MVDDEEKDSIFDLFTEESFYHSEDVLVFGEKIKLVKYKNAMYNKETNLKVACFHEYLREDDEYIPEDISENFEKLLFFSTNKHTSCQKFVYELGTSSLEELVSKVNKFQEEEIATIIKFFLTTWTTFVNKKVATGYLKPCNIQIHQNQFKYLHHLNFNNPRECSISLDYFAPPEQFEQIPELFTNNETIESLSWRSGILCLYLANLRIPKSEVHPMRAIFMMLRKEPPKLENESVWSNDFQDFIGKCLKPNPKDRSNINELKKHPFLLYALTEEDFIDRHFHNNSKKRVYACLEFEEKEEKKEPVSNKEEMPEHLKDRVKGKKVITRNHGLALQCCIQDETSHNRKKFILAVLSEIDSSVLLNLHFDEDQVPNVSFEAKGRATLNKKNCRISLIGYMVVKEMTDDEIVNIAKEITKNRASEIKQEMIEKRKELPKRETKKKEKIEESDDDDDDDLEPEPVNSQYIQDGVEIHNITVGHGRRIKKGDRVSINYKGRVDPEARKSFDQSKIGKPYTFIVGSKKVIKGISIGVTGMANNSKRELVIPSRLAFGKTGLGDKVLPNTTVYYDVEVVEVVPRSKVDKEIRDLQKLRKKRYLTKMRNQESYVKDYDFVEIDE